MKKIIVALCVLLLSLLAIGGCANEDRAVRYTVKFDSGIGVDVPSVLAEANKTIAEPSVAMQVPGKYFAGWYNGDTKWNFATDRVLTDVTLVARWEDYLTYGASRDGSDTLWVTGCRAYVSDVVIPAEVNGKAVSGIGQLAFANTTKIESVTIPSSVYYIANNAFNRCNGLDAIIVPSTVSVMEYGAFSACEGLTSIYCEATEAPRGWNESWNTTDAQVVWDYKNR